MDERNIEEMKARIDRRRSESILKTMNEGDSGLQIYSYDGSGIRKVDDLLSDDQIGQIQKLIEKYLEELIEDTEDME